MFETHKLNDEGFKQVAEFKTAMNAAVKSVETLLPEGREKSIWKTKLEEAVFFGTKAIAAKPENHTEVVTY